MEETKTGLCESAMSRTFRKGRAKNKMVKDKDNNEFWLRHDITPIRKGLNQSFREEEKQFFQKFKETKYKQKPKSRGGFW